MEIDLTMPSDKARSQEKEDAIRARLAPSTLALIEMLGAEINTGNTFADVDIPGQRRSLFDMNTDVLDRHWSLGEWAERAAGLIDQWAARGCGREQVWVEEGCLMMREKSDD